MIVAVHSIGGQDLTIVLASEKRAVYTQHGSTVAERFDAYTEREEHSMQNPDSWELWQQEVLDVYIGAWISRLQDVEETDNSVVRVLE